MQETLSNNHKIDAGGEIKQLLTATSFCSASTAHAAPRTLRLIVPPHAPRFSLFSVMGVGSIVATGIFSFLPYVYAKVTGPAVIISLILSAGTACLSGMCYSGARVRRMHPTPAR